jgi:hypothetical protein
MTHNDMKNEDIDLMKDLPADQAEDLQQTLADSE